MHSIGHSRRQLDLTSAAAATAGGQTAAGAGKERGFVEAMPAVPHTLVRRLPETGARALHVGAYAERIRGWPAGGDDGAALLARLLDWATQPRYTPYAIRRSLFLHWRICCSHS